MSLDADVIVDRRRLRRKLTFWRVLAIVVIALGIAWAAVAASKRLGFAGTGAYIARVTIEGLIRDDRERVRAARSALALVVGARRHRPCRQPRRHHRWLGAAL